MSQTNTPQALYPCALRGKAAAVYGALALNFGNIVSHGILCREAKLTKPWLLNPYIHAIRKALVAANSANEVATIYRRGYILKQKGARL